MTRTHVQKVTIHMKATHKVILTFESVLEILKCDHSNRKATEQFFPVVNYAVQRTSNF